MHKVSRESPTILRHWSGWHNDFLSEKNLSETNSQEQDDSLTTASIELPPAPKLCSKDLYWQKIPLWQDVSEEKFQQYKWQVSRHTLTLSLLRAAHSRKALADEILRLQTSSETKQNCISSSCRRCQRILTPSLAASSNTSKGARTS